MRYKIIKIPILIILILSILCGLNCTYGAQPKKAKIGSYYNDQNLGIQAYKQINAFELTLADGSILADGTVDTRTELNVKENLKDVEIVFILDTSGSMGGLRKETTKKSTQTLIQSLFNKIGKEHLEVGILYFNDKLDAEKILELTNDESKALEHLEKIYASGLTYMADSLEKAQSMLQKNNSKDKLKIICTLSDGSLHDEKKSIQKFNEVNEQGISTISIFVDTPITDAFRNLKSKNHKNFQTDSKNLEDTIVNEIYKEIYTKLLSMAEPVTVYELNNVGMIADDNKIIMQMDNEILHGATLKIEYIISICTLFESSNIRIKDFYSEGLNFSQNQKLLTENKTNKDYKWKVDTNGTLIHDSGNYRLKETESYKVKLVLTTVLTPSNLEKFENRITFSLKNAKTNQTIECGDNQNEKIQSLGFLIIPPTGKIETKNIILTVNSAVIVLFLIAVIFDILPPRKRALKKVRKT